MVDYEFDWSRFRVETKLTGYISLPINHTTKINLWVQQNTHIINNCNTIKRNITWPRGEHRSRTHASNNIVGLYYLSLFDKIKNRIIQLKPSIILIRFWIMLIWILFYIPYHIHRIRMLSSESGIFIHQILLKRLSIFKTDPVTYLVRFFLKRIRCLHPHCYRVSLPRPWHSSNTK